MSWDVQSPGPEIKYETSGGACQEDHKAGWVEIEEERYNKSFTLFVILW